MERKTVLAISAFSSGILMNVIGNYVWTGRGRDDDHEEKEVKRASSGAMRRSRKR